MGVEFEGIKRLEKELETTYGPENMKRISRKALTAGVEAMQKIVKAEQQKHRDTGETVSSITMSDIIENGEHMYIKIHWNDGTKPSRYNVIHLQENGFYNKDGTFNSPSSKGMLQRIMIAGRKAYTETIETELRKSLS